MDRSKFDDIRPYNQSEISDAMKRIADSSSLPLLSSYVYPDEPVEAVREKIRQFTSVEQFQWETMRLVNEQVINKSVTEFSCSGLENLNPDKSYLFISNHRDIMLDASLLQYYFLEHGFRTTEITFGANLMINQLVIDIGKCNKMFKVERPSEDIKAFYKSSLHLSDYIRHTITEKNESVWIAQKNGRTKDGNDKTDKGLVKMLCMSGTSDKVKALSELNIVPIAISYEWEPCDVLKAMELYESQSHKYKKKPGEDLNSILTGILQPKGRVHIEISEPITEAELSEMGKDCKNVLQSEMAKLLDKRINAAYKLYPNNYIAHDVRNNCEDYRNNYTDAEKEAFMRHLCKLEENKSYNIEQLRDIFLGIYSNPVDNK